MPLTLLLLFFFADPNLIIIAAEQLNRHELMALEMLLRSSRMTGSRNLIAEDATYDKLQMLQGECLRTPRTRLRLIVMTGVIPLTMTKTNTMI